MLGSLKESKPVDAEITEVLSKVEGPIKSNLNVAEFTPVSYKTQLVNGTNYFAKVKTPSGHSHVRVHKDLQGNVTFHSSQANVEESTEITHF